MIRTIVCLIEKKHITIARRISDLTKCGTTIIRCPVKIRVIIGHEGNKKYYLETFIGDFLLQEPR